METDRRLDNADCRDADIMATHIAVGGRATLYCPWIDCMHRNGSLKKSSSKIIRILFCFLLQESAYSMFGAGALWGLIHFGASATRWIHCVAVSL